MRKLIENIICDYPGCGNSEVGKEMFVMFNECGHNCCAKHIVRIKEMPFDMECGVCANEKEKNKQKDNSSIDRGGGSV